MQFPIRWRKLILTNGWTLEPINCLPEEVPLADDIKDWKYVLKQTF
jgi:ribonucleotide reductase beta subunit family protein with ferritin-like domain